MPKCSILRHSTNELSSIHTAPTAPEQLLQTSTHCPHPRPRQSPKSSLHKFIQVRSSQHTTSTPRPSLQKEIPPPAPHVHTPINTSIHYVLTQAIPQRALRRPVRPQRTRNQLRAPLRPRANIARERLRVATTHRHHHHHRLAEVAKTHLTDPDANCTSGVTSSPAGPRAFRISSAATICAAASQMLASARIRPGHILPTPPRISVHRGRNKKERGAGRRGEKRTVARSQTHIAVDHQSPLRPSCPGTCPGRTARGPGSALRRASSPCRAAISKLTNSQLGGR